MMSPDVVKMPAFKRVEEYEARFQVECKAVRLGIGVEGQGMKFKGIII